MTEQEKTKPKTKSLKKNAVLNVTRTICAIVFPLITFPYATRVLQVNNMGKVNYGNSIVTYFSLIATLGVSTYGVREGAKLRDDKKRFHTFAAEVFTVNLIATIVAYAALAILLLTVRKFENYRAVIFIESLTMIFTTLGIEWVNTVYEDYTYITIRSIFVQLLYLISVFLMIHRPEDYLIYAGLTVASNAIICVSNLIYCRRYVKIRLILKARIRKHLAPMLVFFSNTLAITLYVSSDTTMLGWIDGDYNSGLYTVSVKVYTCVKQILTAIYAVTIPRLSRYAAQKEKDKYKDLFTNVCVYLILLLLPMIVGLIAYSREVVLLMGGEKYLEATRSLQILAVALFFAVGSGVVVQCFNVSMGFEKISLRATVIAAIVNVGLNVFAIPLWHQDGAAATTVVAEAVVFFYCIQKNKAAIKERVVIPELKKQLIYAAVGSFGIWLSSVPVKMLIGNVLLRMIAGVCLGAGVYFIFLLLARNSYAVSMTKKYLHVKK